MVTHNAFRCTVVTPEKQALDAEVSQVVLPAHDGQVGILPGHAPLLCNLGIGILRYQDTSGVEHKIFIDGGFGHILNNEVTVLTGHTLQSGDVTATEAQKALHDAQDMPKTTSAELEARTKALKRAWSLIALVD